MASNIAKKISQKIRKILNDPEHTKYISVLSFWEISLKFSLDKIDLVGILPEELPVITSYLNLRIKIRSTGCLPGKQ